MIVAFDTNVWVSAFHFDHRQSPPILALERARNWHTIATCDEIEMELSRILAKKFGWETAAIQYRLAFFLAKSIHITITGNLHVCRDPNDDMILECAILAGAQLIVSGDKDFLVMAWFRGIQIVTPAQFLEKNQ